MCVCDAEVEEFEFVGVEAAGAPGVLQGAADEECGGFAGDAAVAGPHR
jgi:hypothetical protein